MRTAFFDVDTQIDFMLPAGALYVPGAVRIIPAIQNLNRHAAAHGIPLVSSTDAHREDDPEFRNWPPHCVVDTAGQAKVCGTLLDAYDVIPPDPADLPAKLAPQVILQKRTIDVFSNPNVGRLLDALGAEEFVVYGVVTEVCVVRAAAGLLRAGRRVQVVTDAIQTLRQEDSDAALRTLQEQGARLTTLSAVSGQ